MKNHVGKIFIGAAVVAIGAAIAYAQVASRQANEGVVLGSYVKGNEAATVTLTEYSDFQCPACAAFYPVVKTLVEQYGDQIKFEYKHFPLISIHPYAVPAAKAAEAAGQQGKFYEMHDMLFENQTTWSAASNPVRYFEGYASELGLDVELFKRHYKASLIEDKINESFAEARSLGLTGTPTFFLNGTQMQFETIDDFTAQVVTAIGTLPDGTPLPAADGATTSAPAVVPSAPSFEFGI